MKIFKCNNSTMLPLPLIDDFLLHIQANNYSHETLYNYERDLDTFAHFLQNELEGLTFPKMTKKTIEQYKAYLNSPTRKTSSGADSEVKLQSGSINRHLTSLRRYLNFLLDMDEVVPVAPTAIKLLRMGKQHGQVAELHELIRLIECPTTVEKIEFVQKRNRAMLETLFASGMRISELIGLRINQLDHSGKIFVEGKGRKRRFIYLTTRAEEHIRADRKSVV